MMETMGSPSTARPGQRDANAAVIVACGGSGVRFRQGLEIQESDAHHSKGHITAESRPPGPDTVDKQFITLAGKPLIAHTLDVMEKHPDVAFAVLVLPEQLLGRGEGLVRGGWPTERAGSPEPYTKVKAVLAGGRDRQASVSIGLSALRDFGWRGPVLVQDGVRPCTTHQVYDRVIEGVYRYGNAVAAIPIRDTVKRADSMGIVQETLNRQGLWQIQTPQGFWMDDLLEAYTEGRRLGLQVTDDAGLMEALGREIHLVEGDPANLKLTYPGDLVVLEALLCRKLQQCYLA